MSHSNEHLLPVTRNQLRAGRIMANLDVRTLAKLAGLAPTTINQLECGRTANPHVVTVEAIVKALMSHGVDFARGGWVRANVDSEHPGSPFMQDNPLIDDERLTLIRLGWRTMHILCGKDVEQ